MRFWYWAVVAVASCGGGRSSPNTGHDAAQDRMEDRADATTLDAQPMVDASAPDGSSCPTQPVETIFEPQPSAELVLIGDPGSPRGIFDPSLVYPAGAPAGALSYSSVAATNDIRTRIAVSTDAGATFRTIAEANAPATTTVDSAGDPGCPGGRCTGQLLHEVSSLIIDPDDPDAARRWKLFTHRYLVMPGDVLRYELGHIALATAPAPEGPWSASRNLIGWRSSSPLSSVGAVLIAQDVPGLADCVALTEPAALWLPGAALDLAVGCVSVVAGVPRIRIERLRSVNHAATFQHVGLLLESDAARCYGSTSGRINAAHLFFAGGRQYVIATPDETGLGYRGCLVFPVDDPGSGMVRRNGSGLPLAVRRLTAAGQFHGACDYAEGATALGYLLPVAFLDQPPRIFRTFATRVAAP
ncbi:MAG: hypothetical protein H7X95_13035 [Deltaproteobacteria bacterium]|nr:hypothetical protein [Deltaproteobacteria bacterium]